MPMNMTIMKKEMLADTIIMKETMPEQMGVEKTRARRCH
jgi:hypothetical protein